MVKNVEVVFVLGGPASGKQTQCDRIANQLGYVKLQLGELLRVEKKTQSPHAKLIIKSILENEKVPVDVIASVLRQAMEKAGPPAKYVIQGFPRDTDDVQGWDRIIGAGANIVRVFVLDCDENLLRERNGFRVLPGDNNKEFDIRYSTYQINNIPLKQKYQEKVVNIDASKTKDEVFQQISQVLTAKPFHIMKNILPVNANPQMNEQDRASQYLADCKRRRAQLEHEQPNNFNRAFRQSFKEQLNETIVNLEKKNTNEKVPEKVEEIVQQNNEFYPEDDATLVEIDCPVCQDKVIESFIQDHFLSSCNGPPQEPVNLPLETFVCDVCSVGFSCEVALSEHFIQQHMQEQLQCQHCDQQFNDMALFADHLVVHQQQQEEPVVGLGNPPQEEQKEENSICQKCNQQFFDGASLADHMVAHQFDDEQESQQQDVQQREEVYRQSAREQLAQRARQMQQQDQERRERQQERDQRRAQQRIQQQAAENQRQQQQQQPVRRQQQMPRAGYQRGQDPFGPNFPFGPGGAGMMDMDAFFQSFGGRAFGHGGMRAAPFNPEASALPQELLDQLGQAHLRECEKPLNENVIQQLPKKEYKKEDQGGSLEKDCTICMSEFEEGKEVTTLTCLHRFCTECVEQWFKTQDFCPVCRTKIKVE